jgi:S-DNA-T family DNA segregation ATPase FtsK/SpoIIIE
MKSVDNAMKLRAFTNAQLTIFDSTTYITMATKKTASKKNKTPKFIGAVKQASQGVREVSEDPTTKVFLGVMLVFIGAFLLFAQFSFLWNWSEDFSLNTADTDALLALSARNLFGTLGHSIGWLFMLRGFGLAGFLLAFYVFAMGLRYAFEFRRFKPVALLNHVLITGLLISVFIAALVPSHPTVLGGITAYYLAHFLGLKLGAVGIYLLIIGCAALYIIATFKVSQLKVPTKAANLSTSHQMEMDSPAIQEDVEVETEQEATRTVSFEEEEIIPEPTLKSVTVENEPEEELKIELAPQPETNEVLVSNDPAQAEEEFDVKVEVHKEEEATKKEINQKVKDFGEYDPTLDLSRFRLPGIDLLQQYGDGQITFDKEEIEKNKNNIVDTLRNYNIEIKEIKATIGPTVTLYEIVPAAGIRISKIKNLEDDIALSLAALGIRIIAPIPGKGTIGIEVPNAKPQMVSMKQVISSKRFQQADMELPVAMGRTITNENFVFDLAKMPHLLMAGATGQGKSVGLNAILTSLLYKKHPSQLKFVLVDPKKVELTLYNKIERHYLAVLPDSDEAIITDTTKVVNTLNSLCIEMDNRYELLKSAMVRNIKEYNAKFISRRLNPEEGHRFLPYIVLVIDEFADLIMTAGKEVEMPIARLAQLARAIGIHLIVATQRPSVNVITGIIKANFPARAAFRVTSKIDSRTILDAGGADQLIGKGDMLFSQGSDLIRLQCAFVDTPEVEEICDFIGNQQAYPMAYQLPEYVGEEGGGVGEIDPSDRDALFEDAARLVVATQQGSTSMIQRKLKLGYNRAGRIVDQLEAAGILGPFEGSKARQVLVPDEMALEQKLKGDA